MPVQLANKSRSTFEFNLYHDKYCASGGTCQWGSATFTHPASNELGHKVQMLEDKLIPRSIRLAPGEVIQGLEDAVMNIPQITEGIRQRLIVASVSADSEPKRSASNKSKKTVEDRPA